MIEFVRRRLLERGDLAALRIDAVEHALDGAVLAGGVHALEDQQQRPAVLGVEFLLEIVQPLAVGIQDLLALVLVEAAFLGGGVRFQMEFTRPVETNGATKGFSSAASDGEGFLSMFAISNICRPLCVIRNRSQFSLSLRATG